MDIALVIVATVVCLVYAVLFEVNRRVLMGLNASTVSTVDALVRACASVSVDMKMLHRSLIEMGDHPEKMIEVLKAHLKADVQTLTQTIEQLRPKDRDEDLYRAAVDLVRTEGLVSGHFFRRRLKIGYRTATRIMQRLVSERLVELDGVPGRYRPTVARREV